MTFQSPPPQISNQLPLWQAILLISVLPASIWLFRWFLVGPAGRFMMDRVTMRIGLLICVAILGAGFISVGYALIGTLNYTRLDADGVRIVKFMQPEKFQRWADLVAVEEWEKKSWEWGKSDQPYDESNGYRLYFKEGGRWSVELDVWSTGFAAADFQQFTHWLQRHFRFEPPRPPLLANPQR
ncbi:MAG: hypothetical protein JNG86_06250 [Verrucomicrobiaceae bacterium]|nr:hypothetical protein [Verrucomicrobiaceae bacterium]